MTFWPLPLLVCAVVAAAAADLVDKVLSGEAERISLYEPGDGVGELFDETIRGSVYGSDDAAWLVEFYAHWCGHCQRYVPIWKEVAANFRAWGGAVKVAAINCAQEDCGDFDIVGTPTIRLFPPGTEEPSVGHKLQAFRSPENVTADVIAMLRLLRSEDNVSASVFPTLTSRNVHALASHHPGGGNASQSLVLLLESDSAPDLWPHLNLLMNAEGPGQNIVSVWNDSIADAETVIGLKLREVVETPALAVVTSPAAEGLLEDGSKTVEFLPLAGNRSSAEAAREAAEWLRLRLPKMEDKAEASNSSSSSSGNVVVSASNESVPFRTADAERAVRYSLTVEVAFQDELGDDRLDALYLWTHSLLKYAPLRPKVKDFLRSLRANVSMERSPLSSEGYRLILSGLGIDEAFDHLPDGGWVGCGGSEPHLRGYPCALWQLFHSLTVGAWKLDPLDPNTRVAEAIIRYVHNFFTCRHCARNFAKEIRHPELGGRPTRTYETVWWLWKIHNTVNLRLKGDVTEDPAHPKAFWPPATDCQACYLTTTTNGTRVEVVQEVVNYMARFYAPSNEEADALKASAKGELEQLLLGLVNVGGATNRSSLSLSEGGMEKVDEYCLARSKSLRRI